MYTVFTLVLVYNTLQSLLSYTGINETRIRNLKENLIAENLHLKQPKLKKKES